MHKFQKTLSIQIGEKCATILEISCRVFPYGIVCR